MTWALHSLKTVVTGIIVLTGNADWQEPADEPNTAEPDTDGISSSDYYRHILRLIIYWLILLSVIVDLVGIKFR